MVQSGGESTSSRKSPVGLRGDGASCASASMKSPDQRDGPPPPKRRHAPAAEALDGPRHAHSSHRRSRGDRPGRCLGSQAGRHVAGMVEPKEYSQDAAKRALPGANLHRTPTREIGRPGRFPDAREPESQDTCPACRRRPADHAPTEARRAADQRSSFSAAATSSANSSRIASERRFAPKKENMKCGLVRSAQSDDEFGKACS